MNIKTIQLVAWLLFLLYYCVDKFLAGYQGYSHAYAIQVVIIVCATAIIPYYLTAMLVRAGRFQRTLIIALPSIMAMSGYGAFYLIFILPNFPDIPAVAVIIRGLIPGVAISMILGLPIIAEWRTSRLDSAA